MKKLIGSIIMMAVSMSLVACVGGTGDKPTHGQQIETKEDPKMAISGGVIDRTDQNAKKQIESKNISEFFSKFYIYDKYEAGNDGEFWISIKDNDKGEHVLKVEGVYNHELVVGDEVLAGVQDIIDRYELVKKNGKYRVVAGLAPEYGPWEIRVLYDSGEQLKFYENGDPNGDWTGALRDYFIKVMGDAGYEDVLPPKEALTIVHFSTAFEKDGNSHHYGQISVPTEKGEEEYFWHMIWDLEKEETIQEEYAEMTDGLFEGIQQVIEENDMFILHAPETVSFSLQSSKDGFLELYVDYENGRQIYCEYNAEELPEEWPAMREALVEYLDEYIAEHKIE